jgi:hypothetical protein
MRLIYGVRTTVVVPAGGGVTTVVAVGGAVRVVSEWMQAARPNNTSGSNR